eukprot:14796173-Heterocapsa_arctica.AAC.1
MPPRIRALLAKSAILAAVILFGASPSGRSSVSFSRSRFAADFCSPPIASSRKLPWTLASIRGEGEASARQGPSRRPRRCRLL